VVLYPDPVEDLLTIALDRDVSQVKGSEITDAKGMKFLRNTHKAVDDRKLEVNVSSLKPGLYLLRLESGDGQQILKFVKK
jgi:hypothetical protein